MPAGMWNRRRLKLVLVSLLAVGVIVSATVRGVYALYSGQESNHGGSIATGTLTLENTNALNSTASTTLSAKVGATTLNGAISSSVTSIVVAANATFPGTGSYTIIVDNEEMTVTAGQGTNTWTVTRGVNGTQAASHSSGATVYQASIGVASATGFPPLGVYTIKVDSEKMMVTGGQGTLTWTVTRGVDGTGVASHASAAAVSEPACQSISGTSNIISTCDSVLTYSPGAVATQTTLNGAITNVATSVTVTSGTGFSNGQVVLVDAEAMTIVSGGGTTSWTVTRGVEGTTATAHSNAAYVSSQTLGEAYPGMPVMTSVAIKDSGSIDTHDLEVYMGSCLRGVTADAPWASTTPTAPSFSSASTTGGSLFGGNTYYYEITAVVGGSESVAGTEASYTPPIGTNTNKITLTWSAVSGASSYKVYRDTTEGGEKLLASGIAGTTYTDSTNTSPSGSPPSGSGSGDPCLTGNGGFYVQETNSSGTATACWYPNTNTACTFDGTIDLGLFATSFNTLGQSLDLGTGPTATNSRYFQIGLELPSSADNSLQGTGALITLKWYGQA
jgi:hypothetical protein